jgi:hypothetical protein
LTDREHYVVDDTTGAKLYPPKPSREWKDWLNRWDSDKGLHEAVEGQGQRGD